MSLECHWAATGIASVSLWLPNLYCEKRNLVIGGVQIFQIFLALTSGLTTKDISHGSLADLFLIVLGYLGNRQETLVTCGVVKSRDIDCMYLDWG